jgi:hypothetical protein
MEIMIIKSAVFSILVYSGGLFFLGKMQGESLCKKKLGEEFSQGVRPEDINKEGETLFQAKALLRFDGGVLINLDLIPKSTEKL